MTAMRKPPEAGCGALVGVFTPAWVNTAERPALHRPLRHL